MRDRLTILWPPDGNIEDIDEELHVCNYCEQVFTEGKEIAYRHVAMAGHISREKICNECASDPDYIRDMSKNTVISVIKLG